jgi:hypothetical protein
MSFDGYLQERRPEKAMETIFNLLLVLITALESEGGGQEAYPVRQQKWDQPPY